MFIIQGEQGEYGTWRQVEAIEQQASDPIEVLAVPKCGHTPHREHTGLILQAMTSLIRKLGSPE